MYYRLERYMFCMLGNMKLGDDTLPPNPPHERECLEKYFIVSVWLCKMAEALETLVPAFREARKLISYTINASIMMFPSMIDRFLAGRVNSTPPVKLKDRLQNSEAPLFNVLLPYTTIIHPF